MANGAHPGGLVDPEPPPLPAVGRHGQAAGLRLREERQPGEVRAGRPAGVQGGPGQGPRRHLLGAERLGLLETGTILYTWTSSCYVNETSFFEGFLL